METASTQYYIHSYSFIYLFGFLLLVLFILFGFGLNIEDHTPLGKSDRVLGSDHLGSLVQTDTSIWGNQQKMQTSGGYGYPSVTQDGDLIYADRENKVINRITQDKTVIEFIKTGDWEPISVHSSQINGDILVGMVKGGEAKVTRYNKRGKEIQNIQRDNQGEDLYYNPHFIVENINGDICTSDNIKRALVVVDKSGQHRFSYFGYGSVFNPWGVCTNSMGEIFVSVGETYTSHLLDQNGRFLSQLLGVQNVEKGYPC